MFRDSVHKFSSLFSPCLVKKTHFLFNYNKKVAIFEGQISNKLDICPSQIGGINRRKIGRSKRKLVALHDFLPLIFKSVAVGEICCFV